MLDLKPEQPSKSSSPEYSLKKEEPDQKIKTEVTNLIPEPKISESEIVPARKAMLPLELLKFKIAQRRYNQLIWKNIKKDLMFFRQKHHNRSSRNLKTRLRLQINQFGKVIERRLLKTSGSQKFDKINGFCGSAETASTNGAFNSPSTICSNNSDSALKFILNGSYFNRRSKF